MENMNYCLEGKTVLVTGGSRGIGLEIAKKLIEQKAKVIICGRKEESLAQAEKELNAGDNLMTVQAHIAKEEDVDRLFLKIEEKYQSLDVLINNVGMNLPAPPLADIEPATWSKIIDSNLNGTFLCSRKAAQIMRKMEKGKIINISSIAGRKATPGMGIYGIAKAAIEMMTKVLASELAPFNINVNGVAPAMVRTDFSKPFWSNSDIHNMIVKTIPLGRIAETDDIVHPVLFLASDAASFITGHILVVDGGSTAV